MKNILLGFLLAVALVWGYDYYYSRFYGRAAATYLFSETEIKDAKGQPLSRADLIDLVLKQAVQKK